MESMNRIFELAMTGEGRLVAAAALYLSILVVTSKWPRVKNPIEAWLSEDSGRLTSHLKKAGVTVITAMAPVAALLAGTTVPLQQVFVEALTIAVSAMGIHGLFKQSKKKSD